MTIHFFIFTITVAKSKRRHYPSLPGYHPTAEDQWLDRKSSFIQYL